MIAFNLVGNTSAVRRLSIWFTYEKFKQMSMKGNAGNTLLLTCSIVIWFCFVCPIPSQQHPSKCHGILKAIKGKLRKRFMHWTETNIYWTSMKNIQHLSNRNLLVRLSFSIALNLKVVSIDRARHINLVGHLFSDHTLLNLKKEQQFGCNNANVLWVKMPNYKRTTSKNKIRGCTILEFLSPFSWNSMPHSNCF